MAFLSRHTGRFYVLLLTSFVGLFGVATLLYDSPANASIGGTTQVVLVPPQAARVNELITVSIVALDVRNLAGFQAALDFDQSRLRVTSMAAGTGLGAGGRDVLAMPPITRPGSVVLGAVTCPVAHCNERPLEQTPRILTGVNGQVVLGTVNFYAEAAGQYQLNLHNVQLADPQGNELTTSAGSATLTVTK